MKSSFKKLFSVLLAVSLILGSTMTILADDGITLPADDFASIESVVVNTAPTKVYTYGEAGYFTMTDNVATAFNPTDYTGLEFAVNYSDSTSDTFTASDVAALVAAGDLTIAYDSTDVSVGSHTVTLTYGDVSTNYTVTVEAAPVTITGIVVDTAPTKVYTYGESGYFTMSGDVATAFNPTDYTGLQFTVSYSDNTSTVYTASDVAALISAGDLTVTYDSTDVSVGNHTVTLTFEDVSATYTVAVEAAAEPVELSGTCGATATWTLANGVLTVSGTGAMTNFSSKTAVPWYDYQSEITTVVIEEGITRVGNYAFMNSAATSVSLPSTLTTISLNAFSKCDSLRSIDIPAAVTSIGNYAFNTCALLRTMNFLGTTPPAISETAFNEDTFTAKHPASTAWSEIATTYGGAVFWKGADEADAVGGYLGKKISWKFYDNTLTLLGSSAVRSYGSKTETPWYSYLSEINEIVVGEGIIGLGNYNFMDCSAATSITLPSTMKILGVNSLAGCSSLTSITIPASVTTIRNYAFNRCPNLSTVIFEGNTAPSAMASYSFNGIVTKVVYPETTSWTGFEKYGYGGAIYWASSDEADETIGGGCGYTTSWKLYNGTLTIDGTGPMISYSSKTAVPWYQYRDQITSIVINDGVTAVGNYAFMECSSASSITIGSGVKTIGINSFAKCTSLTTITIPASVTLIKKYAFNNCTALAEVIFAGSKPNTSTLAFNNTKVSV